MFYVKGKKTYLKDVDCMCTKNELQIILHNLIKAYRTIYGDCICQIYLYGSYARGDFNNDSDIDIVAIVKGERPELQSKLKKIWEISSEMELEYESIISPTVIPYKEFEDYKDTLPYYQNILTEGVKLIA